MLLPKVTAESLDSQYASAKEEGGFTYIAESLKLIAAENPKLFSIIISPLREENPDETHFVISKDMDPVHSAWMRSSVLMYMALRHQAESDEMDKNWGDVK